MQPLAPMGTSKSHANTNMSTTISLAVLDQYNNEIPIHVSVDKPIEFFIPRDPNVLVPLMKLQNVISERPFNFYQIDMKQFLINSNLTVSLHFEIRPSNTSHKYLFIYTFDDTPRLADHDKWSVECLSSKFIVSIFFPKNSLF
jgi:hypothetical protein